MRHIRQNDPDRLYLRRHYKRHSVLGGNVHLNVFHYFTAVLSHYNLLNGHDTDLPSLQLVEISGKEIGKETRETVRL